MKQPIKALWICSWYPNRLNKLGGNFVKRHAEAVFRFADIAVLHAIGDPAVKQGYKVEILTEPFFTIRVYYQATNNPIIKAIRMLKSYHKGYILACQQWGKPNIVHIHVLYPAGIFGWYLYWFKKLPFVITEHRGGYIHKAGSYRGFFMKLFTKLTVRKAKAVLAISEYFASAMKNHGLSNPFYRIVSNVVDTDCFLPPQYSKPPSIFRFLHVSMFDDRIKNISGILRSIAKLSKKRSDFLFNIIGDGYDRPKLIALAQELNILDRFVFFQGIKKHEEVALAMQESSDAFILFSNMESQSCVILEAMSCGLPIIATETGGICERVNEQTGILLQIGDETGLVEAMNYMIDNKSRYTPLVIRQKIVEKCSVEAVGQAIVTVYEEVLSNTEL